MKNFVSLPLSLLLLIPVFAGAQSKSRLQVSVIELRRGAHVGDNAPAIRSGDVFDTGSIIDVQMKSVGASNSAITSDLQAMVALQDSLSRSLTAFQAMQGQKADASYVQTLKQNLQALNSALSLVERLAPNSPNAKKVGSDYSAWLLAARAQHRVLLPADVFQELSSLLLDFIKGIPAEAQATQGINAKLSITQTGLTRQGRSYGDNPLTMLSLSTDDQNYLNQLNPQNLQNQANQLWQTGLKTLEGQVTSQIDPPLEKLKSDLGTAAAASSASLQDIAKQLQQLESLKVTDLNTAIQTVTQIVNQISSDLGNLAKEQAIVDKNLQPEVTALVTAAGNCLKTIEDGGPALLQSFLTAQSATVELQKTVELLVSSSTTDYLIGDASSTIRTVQQQASFSNNDSLRIQVATTDSDKDASSEVTEADVTVHAYKIGLNWVKTLSFDFYPLSGSTSYRTTPALNVFGKYFTRNLQQDQLESIGVGVATFPLGLQQTTGTGTQTAVGVVLSLFDDWVNIGYARNLTTNQYFPFFGIQVPFKL